MQSGREPAVLNDRKVMMEGQGDGAEMRPEVTWPWVPDQGAKALC